MQKKKSYCLDCASVGLAAGARRSHQDREGPQDDRELGYIPGKSRERKEAKKIEWERKRLVQIKRHGQ